MWRGGTPRKGVERRDDRSDWAGAMVSGTGCGKKRWFYGVALRTCISLVRRGALREGVPDTSLKGFRCGTSAAKLWWRPARNVTRSVQAVALVHNPRGWLGEIRPEDGMGFVGLGIEAHPALPILILSSFYLPYSIGTTGCPKRV